MCVEEGVETLKHGKEIQGNDTVFGASFYDGCIVTGTTAFVVGRSSGRVSRADANLVNRRKSGLGR